jgi:hypothetical protein
MRSVSRPEQLPRFFLDRSLGRKAVPEALRADGWDLITLAEHYGMPADERVADTEWIEEAAKRGWPILMKDKRIRHRQAEITAVGRAQGPLLRHHQRRPPLSGHGAAFYHQQGHHPGCSSAARRLHLLGTDRPDLPPLSIALWIGSYSGGGRNLGGANFPEPH